MSTQTTFRENLNLNYCAAVKAAQEVTNSLVGKVVGKVKVSVPQKYQDRSYECAAWSEDRVSAIGVFDIVIRQDPYNKERLFFSASLPATIERDYFPSLFCGNLIGNAYDTSQNAGKPCRNIEIVRADTAETISASSASYPNEDGTKWAIFPELWQAVADYHRALLERYIAYAPLVSLDYTENPNDKYLSNVGQLGYCGKKLNGHSDSLQKIDFKISLRKRNESTDYFTQNNPFATTEAAS